jgi:anti-sigma factor RsiW
MTVTRQVVRDLWPLYAAGDASDDTRRLVEEFFAQDPELARTLRAEVDQTAEADPAAGRSVDLPPNHEAKTLDRVKARLRRRSPFRIVALGFTGLAIARLIEQTSFTTSPAEVIGLAIAALITWTLHGWHTRYILHGGLPRPDRS